MKLERFIYWSKVAVFFVTTAAVAWASPRSLEEHYESLSNERKVCLQQSVLPGETPPPKTCFIERSSDDYCEYCRKEVKTSQVSCYQQNAQGESAKAFYDTLVHPVSVRLYSFPGPGYQEKLGASIMCLRMIPSGNPNDDQYLCYEVLYPVASGS